MSVSSSKRRTASNQPKTQAAGPTSGKAATRLRSSGVAETPPLPFHVVVFGAGKVGRALAAELTRAGISTALRAARKGVPRAGRPIDLLILAVRDRDIEGAAERWALHHRRWGGVRAAVHCAGSLGPGVLAPLAEVGVPVAQMHPLASFASPRHPPTLSGLFLASKGHRPANRAIRHAANALGMRVVSLEGAEPTLYHAAAGLVANGAAALVAAGAELFKQAPVMANPYAMLGSLLRTVAANIERDGLPAGLSGPVRRGAFETIEAHLAAIESRTPNHAELYRALVRGQLSLARVLGEAEPASLDAIEKLVDGRPRRPTKRGRRAGQPSSEGRARTKSGR